MILWAVLVVAALSFLYMVRGILFPFVLAFLISALLEPFVRKLTGKGWPRWAAIGSMLGAFFLLSGGALILILPQVGQQVTQMKDRVQNLVSDLARPDPNDNFFVSWNPVAQANQRNDASQFDKILAQQQSLLDKVGLPHRTKDYIHKYVEPRRNQVGQIVEGFFTGFLGIASGFASQFFLLLFTPLLVWLILMDMESLARRGQNLIPPSIRGTTVHILGEIYGVFTNYLRGVATAIFGYMITMSIVLTIAGVPYAIVLGTLAGVIYLIPYLGGAISMLLIFTVTGLGTRTGAWYVATPSSWIFAFVVLIPFFVSHIVYDSAVFPRLVGKSVGLNPVLSMFVIFSGGALFGLAGMLVAFPLAGAVKVVLDRLLEATMKTQDTLNLPAIPIRHRGVIG